MMTSDGVKPRVPQLVRRCQPADFEAILVGTWAAAEWAVQFYEKHGCRQVTPAEKDRLLRKYWAIPERQAETSVVLERRDRTQES